MDVCKVCGNEFKNLQLHVDKKHNMTMEEYEAFEIEDVVEEEKGIDPVTLRNNLFNIKKDTEDISLNDFLVKYDITKEELVNIIKNYKQGIPLSVTQQRKAAEQVAKDNVELLKNESNVETANCIIAELLTKEHGFIHVKTTSNPKKWILKKK